MRRTGNRPHEFLSIRLPGVIANEVEDSDSGAVRSQAPACEHCTFRAVPAGTEASVDQDVEAQFEGFMNEAWPKALALASGGAVVSGAGLATMPVCLATAPDRR